MSAAEHPFPWSEDAVCRPPAENRLQSYVSTLSQRSNWRRVFCKWWGHEYVQVIDPTSVQLRLVCLRCYGGGNQPFRPSLTALLPPEESVPEMLARVAAEEEAHADDTDRPHYRNRVTPPATTEAQR